MSIRCVFLLMCIPLIASCAREEGNDYCGNHQLVHKDHLASVANLRVDYRADGEIEALLNMPLASLTSAGVDSASAVRQLKEEGQVFQVESERGCEQGSIDVSLQGQQISARFVLHCGSNNKLGKVNVVLFDTFPELQEVEARVSTPVTAKQFIISRQCPRAMLRTGRDSEDKI